MLREPVQNPSLATQDDFFAIDDFVAMYARVVRGARNRGIIGKCPAEGPRR
jgi:hypothetical protein